jgi:hypothetical protein
MCLAVYIASDSQLPLIGWDENKPSFHVAELNGEYDEKVRLQFSKPFVYYVGSHTNCGCGFAFSGFIKDEDDMTETSQSMKQLSNYLSEVTQTYSVIELYVCWEGDQSEKPDYTGEISASEVGDKKFQFQEKQFLEIKHYV